MAAALARVREADGGVRAYTALDPERAGARARELDARPPAERGSLFGLPMAIKGNIAVKGLETTSGSRILRRYRPPFDATAVERLREADAVVLGITNMDEFGMGATTTKSWFGATRNPVDPEFVAGGSSGGSAAAVASGAAFAALGTDTGGSVRQPAAHCGIFGIRPTWGRVSRFGVTAYASSFDQIGCLSVDLIDCGRILGVIAGADPRDATSADQPAPDFAAAAASPKLPHTIVRCADAELDILDAPSRTAFLAAARRFEEAGCQVREVPLPRFSVALAAYYLLACAEASSNLSRFDGIRYGERKGTEGPLRATYRESRSAGLGREVKKRIILGTTALSRGYRDAAYHRALATRDRVRGVLDRALGTGELLLLPVTIGPPRRLAKPDVFPLTYQRDRFSILASLGGLPAISIPAGERSGLPFGIELMGPPWSEAALLSAAAAFQLTGAQTPNE